jgi:4-aminobutyrate aminotransferase-like enzyme
MVATYVRPLPVMVRGQGSYLWDLENRRYLDFMAGIAVTALGHSDPGVTETIAKQVYRTQFPTETEDSEANRMPSMVHSGQPFDPCLQPLP